MASACRPAQAAGLPCLVMIPGTLCDCRIFARQKRALRGIADVRMVDYDSLSPARDWVGELLARLPQRFSVLGFSLGGLWALELLRRAPQRIERMALVASNAYGGSAASRRKSARLWRAWRARGPIAALSIVEPGYFHHELGRRRHAPLLRVMALRTRSRAARAEFAWAAARPDGHAALSAFTGPLLIISGAQDRVCTPAMQRALVLAQPHACWMELPRVGHFVPLEAWRRMADALRHWIATPVLTPISYSNPNPRSTGLLC